MLILHMECMRSMKLTPIIMNMAHRDLRLQRHAGQTSIATAQIPVTAAVGIKKLNAQKPAFISASSNLAL